MPQSVAEAWGRKPVCFASKCANFLVIRGPISACVTRYVPCPQSPARVLWPEYFCCHAGVPGVSFEKIFLCSRPSLCLSTWGVVCLALMYVVHGTETWSMTSDALHRLCRNDHAMIRWICGVKLSDDPSMDDLHAKLGICDLAILVRERRLRWFGHVMRSNGEINRVRSRSVPGRKGPGRPKKTWDECVKQDLKVCGLFEAGTQDRVSWRSSVKNSRQEPTPSNGSASQSMAAPLTQRVLGMRTRSFNKTGFDWLIDWSSMLSGEIYLRLKSYLVVKMSSDIVTEHCCQLYVLSMMFAAPTAGCVDIAQSIHLSITFAFAPAGRLGM